MWRIRHQNSNYNSRECLFCNPPFKKKSTKGIYTLYTQVMYYSQGAQQIYSEFKMLALMGVD